MAGPPILGTLGRALRHRNYRLFFAGQTISLIGTWLTRVATSWLVFRLTHSEWLLGLVGFAGQLPTSIFAPLAGVWVDRWNRHRVLVVTQALAMLQSALLAWFALKGTIGVPHILLLNAFQGLINAFDTPARQSFVVEMIEDRADLPNAIALNSSMVNLARLLGPAIAGVLIAAVGEGWCFLLDAVSYLAVIGSLGAMRIDARPRSPGPTRVWQEMAEGFRYAHGNRPIRSVVLLLSLVCLLGYPFQVLMPVFASKVLGGGPHLLGFLMAAVGSGALLGALWLASRRSVLGLGRVVAFSALAFGVGLAAFSQARVVWLALPFLFVGGMGFMVQTAASNTILQTVVEDDKRGRVMSLYTMAIFGTAPLGALLAGAAAHRFGAPATVFWGGVACCGGGLLFLRELPALRRAARPVYQARGILPEA